MRRLGSLLCAFGAAAAVVDAAAAAVDEAVMLALLPKDAVVDNERAEENMERPDDAVDSPRDEWYGRIQRGGSVGAEGCAAGLGAAGCVACDGRWRRRVLKKTGRSVTHSA